MTADKGDGIVLDRALRLLVIGSDLGRPVQPFKTASLLAPIGACLG